VDFNVKKEGGKAVDRAKTKVYGKRKRGGAKLSISDPLLCVTTSDGEQYILRSCVEGALLEINNKLITDFSLLATKAATEGYIAIIRPPFKRQKPTNHLIGLIEYKEKRNTHNNTHNT